MNCGFVEEENTDVTTFGTAMSADHAIVGMMYGDCQLGEEVFEYPSESPGSFRLA